MKRVPLIKLLVGSALALAVVSTPVIASDSSSKDKKEVQYPNATRKEPKLDLTSEKDQKAINEGLDAVNNQDKEKAIQVLQPIADNSKSKYAQALALQGLASVHYNDGDVKGGIELLKKALDNGVMPNDTFFSLEYMLAQFYLADEQYQQSVDTIEKWRAEGKRETAESYGLEGNAYYRLEKYPEAIAAIKKAQSLTDKPNDGWNQILLASYSETGQGDQAAQVAQQQLAANPNDPNALNNAVSVLMQAQKYPEAITLMEKARANGQLKTEKDYILLAKLYLISGQQSNDQKEPATKALAVLQEGFGKNVVTATAENYQLLGAANIMSENMSGALAAYQKAIPLAKDGEANIRAGQLLIQDNKYSEAKGVIQQGIDKGVQKKGTAYLLLAQAYIGLKDQKGATAAMEKAAQDPETAAKAKAWLKSPTVKK